MSTADRHSIEPALYSLWDCGGETAVKHYDVIVIGAGIIGLSIAWQLTRRSRLKIAVLEKGGSIGEGSTGASSAVCRYRYTLDMTLNLARDGIHAYRHWREFTGLERPRAKFQQTGVLWMPGSDREWADREHTRMQGHGIATEVLDDAELRRRFPALSGCTTVPDVETGATHDCRGEGLHLLEVEGGYMDPVDTLEDLREACIGGGICVRMNTRVTAALLSGGRVSGVRLADGMELSSPLVVNAAGPWCRDLMRSVGLEHDWELVPTRVQTVYLDRPEELPGHIPTCVDMGSGIYFRTQNRGQQLLVGSVLERDEREAVADPDAFQREPDDDFLHRVLHMLHHRIPGLPYTGKVRGYCGLYTVNRNDVHPLVGPTAVEGFWVANGFSGHGFKLGPAIGSMVARGITGVSTSFDAGEPLSGLSIERSPIPLESKTVLA